MFVAVRMLYHRVVCCSSMGVEGAVGERVKVTTHKPQ